MKKGIIITSIFIVIAVVLTIVFINLFREKDTRDLSNQVANAVQGGYLDDEKEDGEFQKIDEYFAVISASANEYEVEIRNVQRLYHSYVIMADFYNNEMVFTEFNDVYKENKKNAINGLNEAKQKAEEMVEYIDSNAEKTSGSTYWQARTWVDVRDMAFTFVDANNKLFDALQNIYQGCVTSKLANNDFSTLVLKTINSEAKNVRENISEEMLSIDCVVNMTTTYLQNGYTKIMNYLYDASLQTAVADINKNGEESSYYQNLLNGTL